MRNSLLLLFLFAFTIGCHAQLEQRTENQTAFAKTYGYVKYFHPSDEASAIDWNRFAIYGAKKVENCSSETELVTTLRTLFEPIAPTIKFNIGREAINYDFKEITPEDTKDYELAYWQHKGVSLGMKNSGRPYSSIRVNRGFEIDKSSSFGNIMTAVAAADYAGKEFRYTGWVKLEKGSTGTGNLWFRVDNSDGSSGFFDNMGSNPIVENEWKQYEIRGTIDQLASNLVFGCFLNGKGRLLLDDIQLTYKEGTDWVNIPLENSGFESNALTDENQWGHSGAGYAFNLSETDQNSGNKSAVILYEGTIVKGVGTALFDQHPDFGELMKKRISENIVCQIPLTLYYNNESTYPKSNTENLQALKKALQNTSLEATNLSMRLGNVINTYNVFQHFYPYFHQVDVNWAQEFETALLQSYTDKDEKDHLVTLQKLTAPLKDGHIRVSSSTSERFVPPIDWEWVEDKLLITDVYDATLGLNIGDEILKINGEDAIVFFKEINARISAGTVGWLKYRAQTESLYGPKASKVVIETKNQVFELIRDQDIYAGRREKSIKKVAYKEINKEVFYLNLDLVTMDTINTLLPKMEGYQSLIFDLRGYPKGNHDIISHLLKTKDTTMGWMQVTQVVYPDQEDLVGWEAYEWSMSTAKPYLGDKQIIFITDGRAISYAESFMGYIEGYHLGTIVGQPTAGTNGNVNPFELPGGYRMSWTGMKVNKHDGSQHHAVGVTPDVYVSKTIEGVKSRKDEFLEKAIELTNNDLSKLKKVEIKD